ncbi:universal stress protein [Maribius pontilimi]|uniref:Universal stress protein n=1 Tax=Palleronia pontilimi TaxID=1964209 RepID=A0A934MB05_9RHOB|nr:universal stress protein [Palleronia pontilimi]MBJ3761208.1 universal stress protein [Palleronia pontilimi]
MYSKIMFPVDLAHVEQLQKALGTAADLAKLYGAKIYFVGVTSYVPTKLGRNPDEYAAKLSKFSDEQARAHDITTEAHTVVSHDPTTDVDDALLKTVGDIGADLVVMASHVPGVIDYVWPSNGGKMAVHSKASVMIVRN